MNEADFHQLQANLEAAKSRKKPVTVALRRSKYRAVKTVVDKNTFDSKAEAARYLTLKAMLAAGEIRDLQLQPEWKIEINGYRICKYRADFMYRLDFGGPVIVEDVKGMPTPAYRLKRKLMLAVFGINVVEIKNGKVRP